jgi:hypothetical protein
MDAAILTFVATFPYDPDGVAGVRSSEFGGGQANLIPR